MTPFFPRVMDRNYAKDYIAGVAPCRMQSYAAIHFPELLLHSSCHFLESAGHFVCLCQAIMHESALRRKRQLVVLPRDRGPQLWQEDHDSRKIERSPVLFHDRCNHTLSGCFSVTLA